MDPQAPYLYFGTEMWPLVIAIGWSGWYILKGLILPPRRK